MDSQSSAVVLLQQALSEPGIDEAIRANLERDLAWVVAAQGDIDDAVGHARQALKLSLKSGQESMAEELRAAVAFHDYLRGDPSAPARLIPSSSRQLFDGSIETHPRVLYALMLKWSDDLSGARAALEEMRAEAELRGEEIAIPFLSLHLAEVETWAGQWNTANRHATLGLVSATRSEGQPLRAQLLYARALVQAHLGRTMRARDDAERGARLASTVGSSVTWLLNKGVLGFLALSLGHPSEAAEHLDPMLEVLWTLGIEEPGVVRFVPDAIEAFIATGDLDRASAVLEKYKGQARRVGRASAEAAALRCRGLLSAAGGDMPGAVRLAEKAVGRHRSIAQPFELGRSLFVLGLVLRRARRQSAARASLLESVEIFGRLGAAPWRDQAEALLSQQRGPRRSPNGLSPAEHRVGLLVASGATNQEAAHQLFVSVRAVEAHLTSIYRKLGIRSRTELAARLGRNNPPTSNLP
jgi:DNA-binding CsgD family transcriptional regulator